MILVFCVHVCEHIHMCVYVCILYIYMCVLNLNPDIVGFFNRLDFEIHSKIEEKAQKFPIDTLLPLMHIYIK